jgi:hypothetical protein
MVRPKKINDLLLLLSVYEEGLTWTQLLEKHELSYVEKGEVIREVLFFPMPTLDRLLRKLVKKGLVEKELIQSGRKGRPMGKYKLAGHWEQDSLVGVTVPNMERDEEGKLLLVRKVRDCSPRIGGRKHAMKTAIVGDHFEKYSNIIGDRGIKINTYKERFSLQGQGPDSTPQKKNCQRCGKTVHFVLGTNELCLDCFESPKESLEP